MASLDSPLVQQTKSEIRSLVAEIADLASRPIEPSEFYRGMLTRVCAAMGATGAGVWAAPSRSEYSLIAQFNLPAALQANETRPSDPHRRILDCVRDEGSPILVPPSSIALEVTRPNNPLDESLLIVPVRVGDNVDYFLEIVQRPGGGPVAQRGYLRFVAQMGDLMSDFLRRHLLRSFHEKQAFVDRLQQGFIDIANCSNEKHRPRMLVDLLEELLNAQPAILIQRKFRHRVQAISGIESPDPCSETIRLAERLATRFAVATRSVPTTGFTPEFSGANSQGTRSVSVQLHPPRESDTPPWAVTEAALSKQLCELLGASKLFVLRLHPDNSTMALLPLDDQTDAQQVEERATEIATLCAPLLARPTGLLGRLLSRFFWLSIPNRATSKVGSPYVALAQRCALWIAAAGLAVAVAVFPVPQNVTVTALLEPVEKQAYYAPSAALVDAVHVDQDASVKPGDVLLELIDQELQAQIDQLLGQQTETALQIAQIKNTVSRNAHLPALQRDQLEAEKEQLAITSSTLDAQLRVLRGRLSDLRIIARQEGQISTWDVRSRLSGRPVQPGQLLATTFRPDGPWRLQLSIPEHRVGLISQAISASDGGAKVRFSLSSHPGEALEGQVSQLGSQTVRDASGQSIVLASAKIESESLPIKKDGAIARATIECGRVPAIWLVSRDAVWAITSRIKMMW